jgi:hypothetical protein
MKVLIYDATDKSFVGKTWKVGATLFRPFFHAVIPAHSWDDALSDLMLLALEKDRPITEVQLWSHGGQGQPLINKKPMPVDDYRVGVTKRWWFRCCYTLGGTAGHKLANALAKRGIEVAGHTVVIGYKALHPRLYALRAHKEAWWSTEIPDDAAKPKLRSPRTITAFRMSLPKWAFNKGE